MKLRHSLIALTLLVISGTQLTALAQDELRGMFRLTRTTTDVVGAQTAQALSDVIPVDDELQWQVYVPENYDRRKPAGALVFIDPGGWGGMPDQFRPVLDNNNLIWIGANRSSARISEARSVWMAILASRVIQQDYTIDLNRLYIGSAGNSATTSLNTILNANEFVGAIYVSGSTYWGSIKPEQLENLRRKQHVFITGSNDKAQATIRTDYENYKKDGIANVKLIYDTKGPGKVVKPEYMDEAIRYLDSRLAR